MFFTRLAVVALSVGVVFAAPINVVNPKLGEVAVPTDIPTMVSRAANVQDALAALEGATQLVESDLNSFAPVPIDDVKAMQLVSEIVKLGECISEVRGAISGARNALPTVDLARSLRALKQIGEKFQSMQSLKSVKVLASRVDAFKSTAHGLAAELISMPQGIVSDEVYSLANSLLSSSPLGLPL
ncbi:hypothetical protein FRC11_012730 [Ceratobasidium sp. 423]|nr:hypothetical protein FRC11_012730 [Ceratobasidium sp. 423]